LNSNFADGLANWEIVESSSGAVLVEAPPTSGITDQAAAGTAEDCVGIAAASTASSVLLPGADNFIDNSVKSDPVSITEGSRLFFAVTHRSSSANVNVYAYLASDGYDEGHFIFANTSARDKRYGSSCDLSAFAGEQVKFRFQSGSTNSTINLLTAAITDASGRHRFPLFSPDPVSLVSGALTHQHTDIAIPGRGVGLDFTRSYNSEVATTNSDLGYGWSHNYGVRLAVYDGGSSEIRWPSGARAFFTKSGSDFIAPFGTFDTLTLASSVYTLTTTSQIRYLFDSTGRLTSIKDRNDNTTTIAYSSGTEIDTVTDAGGRVFDFTYSSGRIIEIEDPLTRIVEYDYDGSGDLVMVTDVKGGETDFTYDSHRMLTITNALNELQVTNTYDSADRVVKQVDAEDGITCFHYGIDPPNPETTDCPAPDYTPAAGETVMVDGRGIEEIHQFDTSFRPTAVERVVDSVDIDVFKTYETDSDRCTYQAGGNTLLNEQFGNLCSVTDPLGNITSYRYDEFGNVLAITLPLRQPSSPSEDNFTECGTNGTGDGVDDDSDMITDDGCPSQRFTYTALNDIDVATDALGNQTDYDYTNGNLTSITNALSEVTSFDYNDGNDAGLITEVTDDLTHTTAFTYDIDGNRLSVEDAEGNITSYTFDDGGRVLTVTDPMRQLVGTAESGSNCGSDGTGNGVNEDSGSDNVADDGCPSTVFAYDNQNNLTKVTESYDGISAPITEYFYDAVGNQTSMRDANRQAISPAESGSNCDSATGTGNGVDNDSDGKIDDGCLTKAFAYDDKNRLITEYQARVVSPTGSVESAARRTDYTYDENDNLKTVKDPMHSTLVTEFTYDEGDRLRLVEHPDVHYTTEYTYDAAGRLLNLEDTWGECVIGNCSVGATDSGLTTYDYDANNRLKNVETQFFGTTSDLFYTYDAQGNRKTITYPDNTKVATYTYDELNRMKTVVANWFSGTTTYMYDAGGRLDRTELPSSTDINTTYDYDDANRLVGISNADGGGTISSSAYVLDDNGNRTQLTDTEGVTTYTYDALQRLTSADYPSVSAITYTYDKVGNRLTVSSPSTTYEYNQVDQLKIIAGSNTTQDKNGNLLTIGSGGNNAFLYDYANRLYRTGPCRGDVDTNGITNSGDQGQVATRINDAEGSADYDRVFDLNVDGLINSGDQGVQAGDVSKTCYNTGANTGNARNWFTASGLRMRQRTFFASSLVVDDDYVWDAGARLPVVLQDVRDPSSGSTTTTTYLYGLGLIAQTESGSGNTHFYLANGLGSTTELVESDGDVANTYTYDVWGALRSSSGSVGNQFDFTGEQADHTANRGLVYLRARFYDPALGRFLSRDPLPIGNRYAYAGGNPVNATDPSGHCFEPASAGAFSAASAAGTAGIGPAICIGILGGVIGAGACASNDTCAGVVGDVFGSLFSKRGGKSDASRRRAMASLGARIEAHKNFLRDEPCSQSRFHWIGEINSFIKASNREARKLGLPENTNRYESGDFPPCNESGAIAVPLPLDADWSRND
jgi:RHS repeat-associated protein